MIKLNNTFKEYTPPPESDDELMEQNQFESQSLVNDINALSSTQRKFLNELVLSHLEEGKTSIPKIAKKLGVSKQALYLAKSDPTFANAFAKILKNLTITNASQTIKNLERSSENGDTSASRTLLQFAGLLANVTKNLNLNMELNNQRPAQSLEESVDNMIIRLAQLSIHPEAFANRYIELKNEGRF